MTELTGYGEHTPITLGGSTKGQAMSQAAMNTYVTELEAENERLREALAEAEKVIKPLLDDLASHDTSPGLFHDDEELPDKKTRLRFGDLRAARRWLEERK